MIGLILLLLGFVIFVAWMWAGGIDYMHTNHPDYKGKDFLNEEDKNEIL